MLKIKEVLNKKWYIYLIIFGLALVVSVHSTLSPLNFTSFLGYDVAVWTNIAQRIIQGDIMYVDFFDHKGPVLYFIYSFGYMIAKEWGIWLIDIITNIISMFFVYKISDLILKDNKKNILIMILSTGLMLCMCLENPCTESLSLPFTLISLYIFLKFMQQPSSLTKTMCVTTGICFALVLLLRPNLVALWVVFYLYILIAKIKEKQIKSLMTIILFCLIGATIVIGITTLYLAINGAMDEFIESYILFNFEYAADKLYSIPVAVNYFVRQTNAMLVISAVLYIALIIYRDKVEKLDFKILRICFIYFVFALYLVIMPLRPYMHYLYLILPPLIIPIIIFIKLVNFDKKQYIITVIAMFVFTIYSAYSYSKLIRENANSEDKLSEVISDVQAFSDSEDNVLVLGNRTIVYLRAERKYDGKYFFQLPIANQSEEVAKEILDEINSNYPKLITVVWTLEKEKDTVTYFETEINNILNEKYNKVKEGLYLKRE